MRNFTTFFVSPTIFRVINSWRMRWAGPVAHVEEMRNAYKVLVRKPEEKRQL
jgi:hypothetical protein